MPHHYKLIGHLAQFCQFLADVNSLKDNKRRLSSGSKSPLPSLLPKRALSNHFSELDKLALAFEWDEGEHPSITLKDYLVHIFENLCVDGFGEQYILAPFAYLLRLQNTQSTLRLNRWNLHK